MLGAFDEHGMELIQRDAPIESWPIWGAVSGMLDRLHRGEPIAFPLDITEEVAQGPF